VSEATEGDGPAAAPPKRQARVDELYDEFVRELPEELHAAARGLPRVLDLAPSPDVPWSEVFSHAVTLGAPRLVAAAMPGLPESVVRDAERAHLLAIIEAFGTDRLLDGQVDASDELEGVLARARAVRNASIARVDPEVGYDRADAETAKAIRAEGEILRSGEPVAWSRYLAVSHGKQRLGLPASLALARAAGWDARKCRSLARTLDAVWLGLQLHDDVVDWEGDLSRGGAWAASLAAHVPPRADPRDRRTIPVSARRLVLESGVLRRMLLGASRCFRAARRRAKALGLAELAAWSLGREMLTFDLARREVESPGYTNRAHALSHWARTVLEGD
jgi:hypothetical protein